MIQLLMDRKRFYTDEELLEDLKRVAQLLGKDSVSQTEYKEHGVTCVNTQIKRFGTWNNAVLAAGLQIFVYKRLGKNEKKSEKKKNTRAVSNNLRHLVMKRDLFRCVYCGRSPSHTVGLELHVDHIKAVANGGLSVLENLQTLCSQCNWGKGTS